MKKIVLLSFIFITFLFIASCSKKERIPVSFEISLDHIMITFNKGKKTETIDFGELCEENQEELYNYYKIVNPSSNMDRDEFIRYYSPAKTVITNYEVEDNKLYKIYKNGEKEEVGLILEENYGQFFELYKPFHEGIYDNSLAFYDALGYHNEENEDFSYVLINEFEYAIAGYTKDDSSVKIPAYYKNLPVTKIMSNAFKGTSITHIECSFRLETVEEKAFYFATKLKSIQFNNPNTIILSKAFAYDTNLEEVILPSNIEMLSDELFYECKNLKTITLPSTLLTIGNKTFFHTGLEEISLPTSLESIGSEAFSGCSSLLEITIPEQITILDTQTFYHCTSLSDVYLNPGLQIIGSYCFAGDSKIKNFQFNDHLTTLDGGAFENCSSLEEIIFPSSLRSVGTGIFMNCTSLEKVITNEGLTELAASSFAGCTNLANVSLTSTITFMSHSCFSNCKSLKTISLPKVLRAVYDGDFNGCSALESLIIPDSVKLIGGSAIANCTSLKELIIPDSVTTLTNGCIKGCNNLQKLTVPYFGSSPTEIGKLSDLFGGSIPASLTTLVCSKALREISVDSLKNASNLKTIEMMNPQILVEENALSFVSNLENIILHFLPSESFYNTNEELRKYQKMIKTIL